MWSPDLAPVWPVVFTNLGPTVVVFSSAGGVRRVFTNVGPTFDCDLHVDVADVEVGK
jgi:hypothetical protein